MAAKFHSAIELVPCRQLLHCVVAAGVVCCALLVCDVEPAAAEEAELSLPKVQAFFQNNCARCHGGEEPKGEFSLSQLREMTHPGAAGQWERALDALQSGEMPPEDQPQPTRAEREQVSKWINAALRRNAAGKPAAEPAVKMRRLTNFEYENTMRDLLGFRLKLIDHLPRDPVKAYKFNNTAEFMLLGPEQISRYLECARKAMASAIVDPQKPEVHRTRREWNSGGNYRGLGADEVGVWGNRRNTAANGMRLKSYPATGEFRIRLQTSAILPPGIQEMPLRLVMGYDLGENSSTLQIEPVGTMRLSNNPDNPAVYEFRGRIENYPPRPAKKVRGRLMPPTLTITPQNLYDDGTLNDGQRQLEMPRAVINWMEFEGPIVEPWPPEHHRRILFDSPLRESDPQAYAEAVIKRFMSRAYRRPATAAEVARFVKVYELVAAEAATMEQAMRETLAMVLVSPQFLYHTTASEEVPAAYELASRLSYFLWGSMPDEELLKLAASNKLLEPAVTAQQVRRLLTDDRAEDFVDNFATQWLSLAKMKTVPLNRELFPRFLYYVPRGERAGTEMPYRPTIRDYMHQETVGFIAELIRRNASVLNIVDSDFAFLNQPLAAHYGVEGVQGDKLRPVPLKPQHQLGGLLTHGSVLVGNGTGSAPHPIYRAVWLREAILGDEVAPPPADVPALTDTAGESAETALTIKDLLRKHRQKESCNNCHARLDPWGIPFEHYNATGRFQPVIPKQGTRVSSFNGKNHGDLAGYQKYLQSLNTVTVDASAKLPGGPEVQGMAGLKQYLKNERQDDIARNIIRRLMTYGAGRELTWRDRFVLDDLLKQARDNGYKLQDMIIAICCSETFRNGNDKGTNHGA